jgi:DNA processing protein
MRTPEFWQAFLSLDLSVSKSRALLSKLGTSCVTAEDLENSPTLSSAERQRLAGRKPLTAGQRELLNVVSCEDGGYPNNLKLMQSPPVALMAAGQLLPEDALAVAIVGTRKASPYGRATARRIATELANAGVTVVSGAAFGIDAEAQKAAMQAGGRTIAVVGSGLDRPYPASHRGLLQEVARNGAVVSQFALGAAPDWWRFPERNYVIAGLARAIVVIEAPNKSGALLTANLANEEGRMVFVVPSRMDDDGYVGSFRLINDGATLLYSVEQIFESLGIQASSPAKSDYMATSSQKAILEKLSSEPRLADTLSEELDQPAGAILAELTRLEVEGLVAKSAGGFIRL